MGARVKVGGVFCHRYGFREIDFLVLADEEATSVRFKRQVPGWRLLVLDVRGLPWEDVVPATEMLVPKGCAILQRLERLA